MTSEAGTLAVINRLPLRGGLRGIRQGARERARLGQLVGWHQQLHPLPFGCPGGDGNGPLAGKLNPSPRNFQDHGFWSQRTEGEIFWLIKNGSPGTGLVGYGDQLTDGEIWGLIQYLRSFTGEHGPP